MEKRSMGRGRLVRVAVSSGVALSLATTAFAGVAGASKTPGVPGPDPAATLACIAGQGVGEPPAGGITNAWLDQVVAAARTCGFEIPPEIVAKLRDQAGALEAMQRCLENAGIQPPPEGQPPSLDLMRAVKAALDACGIAPPPPAPAAPPSTVAPPTTVGHKPDQPKPSVSKKRAKPSKKARPTTSKRTRRR